MRQNGQTSQLLLLNKPYQVLSQFTDKSDPPRDTLAKFVTESGFYAAGRLDYDSEGLLLLTDSGALQSRIADPAFKLPKHYWVQVEGNIEPEQLAQISTGVELRDGLTKPAKARVIMPPSTLWPRNPAVIGHRAARSNWLEIEITEGKNRQIRRMCAKVGLPVVRLVRHRIGQWSIDGLQPGDIRVENVNFIPQPRKNRPRSKKHDSSVHSRRAHKKSRH